MKSAVTNLPNDDHVMRHVSWTRLRKDEDDNILGFLPDAFQRNENHTSLSVNWLEYFEGDRQNQIQGSVRMFRKTITVRPKSAFGIGNVAKIKEVCRSNGANVRIVYEPEENNPSHSGIRRLPRDDFSLLEALAADAFVELVHNTAIPLDESGE
jgi:hypothetical protein